MSHIIHTNDTMAAFIDISPEQLDELCREKEARADKLTCKLLHPSTDRSTTVKVIDDSGDARPHHNTQWRLFGHEFGPTHLIRSWNESDAYEVWIDEQPTIAADEVYEAYGAYDKLVEWLESKGHENTVQLRHFASRYAPLFFGISVNDETNDSRWDEWPLIEGYQYQSNSSGTGIVDVGHYEWIKELDRSGYTAKLSGTIS